MDGQHLYRQLFAPKPHNDRKRLDHRSLPTPLQYLSAQGLLTRKPMSEWAAIVCPAHKDGAEKKPSLRVNLIDGHFKCMACGARGGDIVALHRLITGRGFLESVRNLRARFHD